MLCVQKEYGKKQQKFNAKKMKWTSGKNRKRIQEMEATENANGYWKTLKTELQQEKTYRA